MYLDTFQQLPEDLVPKIGKVASDYSLNHQSSSTVSLQITIHATICKGILATIIEQGHGMSDCCFSSFSWSAGRTG